MASGAGRNSRSWQCFRVALWGDYVGGLFVLGSRPWGTSGVGLGVAGLGVRESVGVWGLRRPPRGLGRGAILRGVSGDSRERLTF